MSSKVNHIQFPIILAIALAIGFMLGYKIDKPSKQVAGHASDSKIAEVYKLIEEHYFDTIEQATYIDEVVRNILAGLDPHSSYMTKQETQDFTTSMSGEFEGIGIQFNMLNDTLTVASVIAGGPSEKVGLLPGDKIVVVDGDTIAGVHIQNSEIIKKIRGKKGTKVNIELIRSDVKTPLTFTIKRDAIPINSIDYSYIIASKTGYISIDNFNMTTAEEFEKILSNMVYNQQVDKLIIDLRGNPGGFLGAAVAICDEMLPKGEMIVYAQGLHFPKQVYKASSRGLYSKKNQKVVILIDENSASASEVVSGAIQDNDRGIIIGRTSFGKGLVQTQYQLSDGSEIMLTVARYYTPLGRCIQRPFKYGEGEEYYMNAIQRYETGEMQDTLSQPKDNVKYVTRSGKVLYGGGGITPDIIVPIKTSKDIVYFNLLANSGVVYQYALQYGHKNRNILKNKYKNTNDFLANFEVSEAMVNEIVKKGEEQSIKQPMTDMSKQSLKKWTKAYIGKIVFGDDAYYPLIHQDDDVIKKALEVLNN